MYPWNITVITWALVIGRRKEFSFHLSIVFDCWTTSCILLNTRWLRTACRLIVSWAGEKPIHINNLWSPENPQIVVFLTLICPWHEQMVQVLNYLPGKAVCLLNNRLRHASLGRLGQKGAEPLAINVDTGSDSLVLSQRERQPVAKYLHQPVNLLAEMILKQMTNVDSSQLVPAALWWETA